MPYAIILADLLVNLFRVGLAWHQIGVYHLFISVVFFFFFGVASSS